MDGQLAELSALLDAIRSGIVAKRTPAREPWYGNAVGTVLDNVDGYRKGIEGALASGSPDDKTKAACRVAGIRKGVSDLGILDPVEDGALIEIIDKADMLATRICAGSV